jgi:uncharacterized membrane protein YidH (DUF202 family)
MSTADMPQPPRRHPNASPGLQRERTYLAWQRTGLSFAGIGALLLHVADKDHHPLVYLPGVFGLALGAGILAAALIRYRNPRAAPATDHPEPAALLLGMAAGGATVLGLCALVVIFTL